MLCKYWSFACSVSISTRTCEWIEYRSVHQICAMLVGLSCIVSSFAFQLLSLLVYILCLHTCISCSLLVVLWFFKFVNNLLFERHVHFVPNILALCCISLSNFPRFGRTLIPPISDQSLLLSNVYWGF